MKTTSVSTPTINLSADTVHTTTPGCFQTNEPVFAMPKHGNAATAYTTGSEYFEDLASAILAAKRFILFTDWQMDYDVELTARGAEDFHGRLSELLARKVAEGVEVKVLLYDSVEAAVYTHENHVRQNLMRLNPKASEFGKSGIPSRNPNGNLPVEVAIQRPNTGRAIENVLFSHHQKSVVIDGTLAFVGGMDVTYGRWCTNNFDVVVDPVLHRINDCYNPCIASGRLTTAFEERITAEFAGRADLAQTKRFGVARPGFSPPYYIIGVLKQRILEMLDRGYTLDQMLDLIQIMQIDDQIRDYLLQKVRELKAVVTAVQRTLNRYGQAKTSAFKKLMEGHIIDGVIDSYKADFDLLKVVFRKLKGAADAVTGAISDYVGSQINDYRHWFDDAMNDIKNDLIEFERYRNDPNLLAVDMKRLWNDIADLPSQMVDNFVLEEGWQPRMPWQDIHCRIEGPAAYDVFANFVRRWNVAVNLNRDNTSKGVDRETNLDFKIRALNEKWLSRWGTLTSVFGDMGKHGNAGNVTVQIARSMSSTLLADEAKHASALPLPGLNGKSTTPGYANNTVSGERNMDGILEAMIHAIRRAEAYIYIETQFLISDCELSDNYEKAIANNPLIEELASRIGTMVATDTPFHVYAVLPVHPEGNLQAGGVAKQQYWALQTIKRGRRSLIRRVCEFIVRKQKKLLPGDKPKEADVQAAVDAGAWRDYLSFLNLRNWGLTSYFPRDRNTRERDLSQPPIGSFVITEQIYVHSKLLIVDDAIAIIGSANCNDRSLNGNGDTELAAIIVDNDIEDKNLGNGITVKTRKFARELRIALWRKHLGLEIVGSAYAKADLNRGQEQRPDDPRYLEKLPHPPRQREQSAAVSSKVDLSRPALPATWKAIQSIAKGNARIYEEVFQHTPRNSMKYFSDTQAGWPKRRSRSILGARHLKVPMMQKKVDAYGAQESLVTDYSTLPPQLNADYMEPAAKGVVQPYEYSNVEQRSHIHKVGTKGNEKEAVKRLRQLTGFWVEMPLDFGYMQRDLWLQGSLGGAAVASIDPRKSTESGATTETVTT